MKAARAIVRRLLFSIAVVFTVTSVTFIVNNVIPSDPARMVAGAQARPKDVARIREQLGLDRPLPVRYVNFLRQLVHGAGSVHATAPDHANCGALGPLHLDLGRSYQRRQPVVTILAQRIPRSAALAFGAVWVELALGVGLGLLAASRARSTWDVGIVSGTVLAVSAPTYLTGIFFQYVFAVRFKLVPLDGFGKTFAEHATSMILPALTLGVFGAAFYTRFVREEVLSELGNDYVRTARAKGVGATRALVVHAFRNTFVPLVTAIGLDFGTLIAGAVVTETLFRWPGLGELMTRAVLDRDGPVLIGTVLVASVAVVVASFVVDVVVRLVDPRQRSS